jgi:hypothetical protein
LQESFEHGQPPSVAISFLDLFDATEGAAGGVLSFTRQHSAANVFLGEQIEMRGEFVVEVGVMPALAEEPAQAGGKFA